MKAAQKMISAFSLIVIMALSICAERAFAEPNEELSRALDEQITNAENGFQISEQPQQAAVVHDGWYFRRMWLRLRVTAGISIPTIFTLKVIPEIEMLWERPLPLGWQAYKRQP